MKITLLHPSRGRSEKAQETLNYWLQNSYGQTYIEHILSVDLNDPELEKYKERFKLSSKIIASNNSNVVEATNQAAKLAGGDILIYLSDDFKCPKNWDLLLIEKFKGRLEQPLLVKVDDCLQDFEVDVLTIPVMNMAMYNRLGNFWNPLYKSMFVDQDLYWVAKNNNWILEAPELKFEHEHYSIGKADRDETYLRSDANWNHGKEVYAKRKQENFKL